MPTNLAINDDLIREAVKIGNHSSKKAAVNAALEEYIQHHKQMKILELFGKIAIDPKYNYKKQRQKK